MNSWLNKILSIGRRRPIRVTYYSTVLEKGSYRRYEYTVQVMIKLGSSMRELAIRVIKSSFGKIPNWLEEIRKDQPISIYLDSRTSQEKHSVPHGIGYDLKDDGGVEFLDEYKYESLSHDWTYQKIVALHKAGYISGDIGHIVVETPDGLGGPGDIDYGALILSVLAFISGIEGTLQFKDRVNYYRTTRKFKRNGLHSLKQIRLLLETNETWKLKKVMKAFSVNRKIAVAILKKLGYTAKDEQWSFDNSSTKSLELRGRWLEREKEEEKKISEFILESF